MKSSLILFSHLIFNILCNVVEREKVFIITIKVLKFLTFFLIDVEFFFCLNLLFFISMYFYDILQIFMLNILFWYYFS